MPFGRLRADRWAFLGIAVFLATMLVLGLGVVRVFDDLGVRFVAIIGLSIMATVAVVLMHYKGPGQDD
jgi:hypothetical protein